MRTLRALIVACAALIPVPSMAATLIVDGSGKLTGATGVNVHGTLYDVEFVEGTCAVVFGTCNPSNFAFTDPSSAEEAAQALLDQVFLDGPAGNFDTDYTLTYGCQPAVRIGGCSIFVPYSVQEHQWNTAMAGNGASADSVGTGYYEFSYDTTNYANVFARFSIASSVPEPSTWAMMLFGFGAIGGAMRLRRRQGRFSIA